MERLEREQRLYGAYSTSRTPSAGAAPSAPSSTAAASDTQQRTSPKKAKLSKREKKKARSIERSFGPPAGQPFQPPSSQKRIKLEPGTYRALLEATSPRRINQQKPQQARRPPQFRRINPQPDQQASSSSTLVAGSPERRVPAPVDRLKTPLFLPEDDDELADEIIARGHAREVAARLAAERASRGSPFAVRTSMRPSASGSSDSSDSDDEDGDTFPDHVSESPMPENAQAGPSRQSFVQQAVNDDDTFTFLPGFEHMGQRSHNPFASTSTSPSLPDPVDGSPDLQQGAAVASSTTANKKGKKRAAPDAADADGRAPARKITRRREPYQSKVTFMWMREQCLTADEANDRWLRYLAGRNGHKGDTYRLCMEQRQSVLLSRWMKDDQLPFDVASERLRLLLEREEKEKVARQKAVILASKAGTAAVGTPLPSASAAPPPTAPASSSTTKAPRKPRTSSAVKPPRSPVKPSGPTASRTSAAQSAAVRRKGALSNTARAVELLCATEEHRSPEARLTIIDLFSAQDNSAEVYLSLPDETLRAAWVERRLREKRGVL